MALGEWITNLDFAVLYWIQNAMRCDLLDSVFASLSWAFELGIPWIILGGVLFCFKKTRASGVMLVCAVVITYLFGEVAIKNYFDRIRPCDIDTSVSLVVEHPESFSFPSGHTGSAFAAAMALVFSKCYKVGIPAVIFAALMGFSRLYLFVHFPTDVIAGALFGTLMALITVKIFKECQLDEKINNLDLRVRRN